MTYLFEKTNPQYKIEVNNSYLQKLFEKYEYEKLLEEENNEMESFGDINSFNELIKPKSEKLFIPNNGVNFTYNPNDRIISLDNSVLIKNITLKGEWGQIIVKNGLVRLNNWSAFYLLPPNEIIDNNAKGNNYNITLNAGWKLTKNENVWQIVKTQ